MMKQQAVHDARKAIEGGAETHKIRDILSKFRIGTSYIVSDRELQHASRPVAYMRHIRGKCATDLAQHMANTPAFAPKADRSTIKFATKYNIDMVCLPPDVLNALLNRLANAERRLWDRNLTPISLPDRIPTEEELSNEPSE